MTKLQSGLDFCASWKAQADRRTRPLPAIHRLDAVAFVSFLGIYRCMTKLQSGYEYVYPLTLFLQNVSVTLTFVIRT
jgi:hypothetical protein